MPQEGSVAPTERVNIVYKPSVKGKPEIELPLKLMMVGDYTLRPDSRPVEERKPINIDKDTFGKVMREQKLSLSVSVPDRLSGKEGEQLAVSLAFDELKDFRPDSVIQQVPELKKLLELREALLALKSPLANVREFRKKLQALIENDAEVAAILKDVVKEKGADQG